jgi:hypothetical protein
MTRSRIPLIGLLLAAVALLSACGLQTSQQAAIDATLTMNALDALVQATLAAREPTQPAPPQAPASQTNTPEPSLPQDTPTPTPTTGTNNPFALVNQDTNCRSGPGTVYDLTYAALTDAKLNIVAGSTVPEYVVVEIPGKPGQTCWLWTRYVSINGDISGLAKRSPPPTPTPSVDFTLQYSGVNSCVGWGIGFKLVNTGGFTLKSYKVSVEDTDTSLTISQSADDFDKHNGCLVDTSIPELNPGDKGYAYAYDFAYDPAGHNLKGKVTACTEPGLGGSCSTKSVNFEP